MAANENRDVVVGFFEDLSAGRGREAMAALDEAASWIVAGKPGSLPIAGSYAKADLPALFALVAEAMPDGIQMTMMGTTAEDDRVTMEASVSGVSPAGDIYDNRICFVVELRDRKIVAIREYYDTIHTNEVFFKAAHLNRPG